MDDLKAILSIIIANESLHGRWLNTLSLMENTGARKISAMEDTETVTAMILKHAAEEHRHAYYLKKQIDKVVPGGNPTYAQEYLLAPSLSRHYLTRLDVQICRYIKEELNLDGKALKHVAYLLVTYSIEVRADTLYPVYQQALEQANSKVNVKSIILEEEGHLEEMISQLEQFSPAWEIYAQKAKQFETCLFTEWVANLDRIELL